MIATTQQELDALLKAGRAMAEIREAMKAATKPGVTTKELDELAGKLFEEKVLYQDLKQNTISQVTLVLV